MAPTNRYTLETQALVDELGQLVFWKTNKGDLNKQMYKLFGISRTSHLAYLKDDNSVPAYIWSHLDLMKSMHPYQRLCHGFKSLVPTRDLASRTCLDIAIKGWEKVTCCLFTEISGCDYAGDFSVKRANKKMNKILENDTSGVMTGLLLLMYLDEVGKRQNLSFSNIFSGAGHNEHKLSGFAQAKLFLENTSLGDSISAYKETCVRAIKFFKPTAEVSDNLLASAIDLMIDAKETFQAYPKYQISGNALESCNAQLKIQEQIYVFNSVEELIEQCSSIPNGFSLNLIRTARVTDSFFCLIIKSSENIYLMTDKPVDNEFQRDFMAGRNQRYNLDRYENSMMPYNFIDMAISNGGRDIKINDSKELATTEQGLRVLGHFKEMSNQSILWFTFFMEECRNKFFSDLNPSVPKLGYLSSGAIKHKLLEQMSPKELPTNYIASFSVKQKTAHELSRENFLSHHDDDVRRFFKAKNQWMEDKYNSRIDSSILYIPESIGSVFVLEDKSTGVVSLAATEDQAPKLPLKKLRSTMIGTPDEIQAETDLIARHNKAIVISKMLQDDYENRESEIKEWISKQIKNNLPTLVDKLVSLEHEHFFIAHRVNELKESGDLPINDSLMLRQIHVAKMDEFYDCRSKKTELQKILKLRDDENYTYCAMTGDMFPEYTFFLNVDCILDLEILTGLKKEEFPVELQDWRSRSDLIADRMSLAYDPIEALKNPWWNMTFRFAVSLSSEFVRDRRKKLGVKGRFIMPKNFYDDTKMLHWLQKHPNYEGLSITHRHIYDKPKYAFYTYG
ncbi:hypothetical protein [Photobacterium kishitanii]|uniref:Uncharacterized protein n=1 Tax=Photobacterium kishitanii TaxID=318456 RepID=A0A2T3KLA7_9GAMM|nr:hypothetical protein [Photobacterium kishitanii]PSV00504.1 hypothetical protein C9J27_05050 [Photobacterium kishitanii]